MRVSRRGSQALALGTGVAALLAIVAPHASYAKSTATVDLAITKTAPATATVGTAFTYAITVTNGGTPTTAPAVVTDTLPAGLAFQSASAGCVLTDTNLVTCTLPAGFTSPAALSITVVPVTASPAGGFSNTASVAPTAPDTDPDLTNNTSLAAVTTATGNAVQTCFGKAATIMAPAPIPGQRSTTIDGTNGPDVIIGTRGNDTIDGEGGDDLICGEGGNDHLYGGSGDDKLSGGQGSDLLDGGAGHNVLRGGRDSDGFGPFTASTERRWRHRDHDHDTLICQRRIDDCRSGFGDFDGRDGDHGRRGDHGNRDRIIFVPERSDRFGRDGDGDGFGPGPFSAEKKGGPAKPLAKPAAKPAAKPMPKSAAKSAPVAGTEPVAPKS